MPNEPSLRDRARENATGIVATTVTGVWLAALMLGADWWLAALLFGYIVLVPITAMLFDPEESAETDEAESERTAETTDVDGDADADEALARLRTEYAEGRLTDAEFERRVERLLETETVGDAVEWIDRTDGTREDPATERGRE